MKEREWDYWKDHPEKQGYYAIQYCWDPMEGVFVGVGYWDGKKWDSTFPIGTSNDGGPFSSFEEAKKWAEDNDPDL